MMYRSLLLSTVCAFAIATAAVAQDTTPTAQPGAATPQGQQQHAHEHKDLANMTPEKLLKKLHKANQKEIKLGQLAIEQGESEAVREFGRMLVEDHRKADEQVMQLAQQHNIELKDMREKAGETTRTATATPGQQDKDAKYKEMADKEKAEMERIKGLSGQEFDREFTRMMQHDHQTHVQMLQQAQQQEQLQPVRPLITELIPVLQQHETRARELQQQVGGSSAS